MKKFLILVFAFSIGTVAIHAETINVTPGAVPITGAAGQVLAGGVPPAFTATPTLGASGTVGTLTLGNATSGTVTLGTVTGALGSVTASLPANTGTIAELNLAQTWTAAQAYTAQSNFTPIATVTPSASTITWALASQQVGIVTLGTATPYTMAAATGILSGGTYVLVINQGSTGTQLIGTWNAVFKFPGGTKPTLSTATNSVDLITCVSPDGTNLDCVFQAAFQ